MRVRTIGAALGVWLLAGLAAAQPLPPGQKASLGNVNAAAIVNSFNTTTITVQVQATWVGTITFEGSLDGAKYEPLLCTPIGSTTAVTTTTANGVWSCNVISVNFAQARMSAYTSGAATVSFMTAYVSGASSSGGGGGGAGGNVTIVQGGNTATVNGASQLLVNCGNCTGSGVSVPEDSVAVSGDNVATAGAVIESPLAPSAAVGDYTWLKTDPNSALWVNPFSATQAAGTYLTTRQSDGTNYVAFTGTSQNVAVTSGINVAQGSVSAGQQGPIVQAAATTVAPSYTNATTNPFSMNLAGGLRIEGVGSSLALDSTVTNRLPAGSTPASGESNAITTSRLGSYMFIFNGVSWDRWNGNVGAVVSGTVGITANSSVNVNQLAGTTTDTNSGNKSAGTLRVVLATDQPALTNKLLVTPDSVALPANQSVNVNQIAGTATDVNSGNKSAGTIRVVLATDQPALTNKLLVTPDSVALPANQSVNVAQMNGVATTMGAGATGTGVQRVNDVASSATGAAPPASAHYIGGLGSGATGGFVVPITVCDSSKPITITSATTTLMVTGVSGRQVRICAFHMLAAAADNVAWIEGTGATCGTGTAGMAGGTTAASGYNFLAGSGIAQGSGLGEVLTTATTGDSVCLVTSAATQLSGFIKYAIF